MRQMTFWIKDKFVEEIQHFLAPQLCNSSVRLMRLQLAQARVYDDEKDCGRGKWMRVVLNCVCVRVQVQGVCTCLYLCPLVLGIASLCSVIKAGLLRSRCVRVCDILGGVWATAVFDFCSIQLHDSCSVSAF